MLPQLIHLLVKHYASKLIFELLITMKVLLLHRIKLLLVWDRPGLLVMKLLVDRLVQRMLVLLLLQLFVNDLGTLRTARPVASSESKVIVFRASDSTNNQVFSAVLFRARQATATQIRVSPFHGILSLLNDLKQPQLSISFTD